MPNDEVWWIYNESTGQFEVNVKNTGWVAFSSGDPDQTLAEVLTQGNDAGGLGINNLGIVNVTDLSERIQQGRARLVAIKGGRNDDGAA